jgi:hypothetical protein
VTDCGRCVVCGESLIGQALGADYWVGNGHKWLYRYTAHP